MKFKAAYSLFLIPLLLSNLMGQDTALRVLVVEGDAAILHPNQRNAPEIVVEVDDASDKPVDGATVVFFLPTQGPGGTFANGSNTLTTRTDAMGRANAYGMRPNNKTGVFQIRVSASYRGQTANTTVTQNIVTASQVSGTGGGMGFSTKAWIILGICGAAVAGAVIAATHKSSTSTPNTGITITPGSPTVGAPQ
jgi:hypothetical protein